jgi:hypothetical protein
MSGPRPGTAGRQRTTLILAALLTATPAFAGGMLALEAFNEFSQENAQCAAFYSEIIHCFSGWGDARFNAEQRADYEKIRDAAAERQVLAGKKAGLSDKAEVARSQLAMKSVLGEIDNDCVNISVILNKYGAFCKALIENPAQRLEQLTTGTGPPVLE